MTRTLAIVATSGRAAADRLPPIGKREDEAGAAAGHVLDPDVLAVGLDEGLGDGQAETGPAAGVEADEPVEHRLALVGGDARPGVGDRDGDPVVATQPATVITALRRCVAVGIVQEVSEHLADQELVDVDVGQVVGDVDLDRTVRRARSGGRRPPRRPGRRPGWRPRRTSSTPASIRVMSSRLVTSRVSRSVSTSIRP